MGWIFETESDRKIKMIQQKTGLINSCLKSIVARIRSDNGVNKSNVEWVSKEMEKMVHIQDEMNSLFLQLSPSKRESIIVNWVDGSSHPIYSWSASASLVSQEIYNEIVIFEKSL